MFITRIWIRKFTTSPSNYQFLLGKLKKRWEIYRNQIWFISFLFFPFFVTVAWLICYLKIYRKKNKQYNKLVLWIVFSLCDANRQCCWARLMHQWRILHNDVCSVWLVVCSFFVRATCLDVSYGLKLTFPGILWHISNLWSWFFISPELQYKSVSGLSCLVICRKRIVKDKVRKLPFILVNWV